MFLINFNQWKCACVGINNWVILLRARYKCNHVWSCFSRFIWDIWAFWFISQNSNALFISRLQWLISTEGLITKKNVRYHHVYRIYTFFYFDLGWEAARLQPLHTASTKRPRVTLGRGWEVRTKCSPGSTERVFTSAGQKVYVKMAFRDLKFSQ